MVCDSEIDRLAKIRKKIAPNAIEAKVKVK